MNFSKPTCRAVLKCVGLLVPLVWSLSADAASVKLSWADKSTDESGFRVERRASNGSFVAVATVGAAVQ